MTDLNIIFADDDQLKEIWVSLKSNHMMLQSYNQYCVSARDTLSKQGDLHLIKEVEESMKEVDRRLETINVILESIEK